MRKILVFFGLLCLAVFCVSLNQSFKAAYNKTKVFDVIHKMGKYRKVYSRSSKVDDFGNVIYNKLENIKQQFSTSLIPGVDHSIALSSKEMFLENRFNSFNDLLNTKEGIVKKGEGSNYMITLQEVWKEIRKDSLDLQKEKPKLKIFGGRGEWESSQVVLTSIETSIDSVCVSMEDYTLGETDIELYWGEYVFCKRSVYKKKSSFVQDVLIPMDKNEDGVYVNKNFSTHVDKKESKSIFVNFHIRKDVNPGKYSFKLRVHAFSKNRALESFEIPVEVIVSNFIYDQEYELKMLNSYTYDWTYWYYKDSAMVDSMLPFHYEFMEKNHMSPMHVFPNPEDTRPGIKEWQALYEKGARAFILYYINDPTYGKLKQDSFKLSFLEEIKKKEEYLDKVGLLDYTYIFLFDEIVKANEHQLNYVAKLLKDNGVRSKIFTTSGFPPSKDYIDAWCPLLQFYNKFENHFDSESGTVFKEKWAYTCNTTLGDQYGNVFTDQSHLEPRRIFWNVYERKLTHFQYYTINRWDKNLTYDNDRTKLNKLLDRERNQVNWVTASYADQNGDGQLTYPGNNGEIWPTPRLFSYRDGIEDHQLFFQKNINRKDIDFRSRKAPLELRSNLLRGRN